MRLLDRLRGRGGSRQAEPAQTEPTHMEPERPDLRGTDEDLVYTFRQTINRCWALREPYARLWMYCAAFLRGDQWADWDSEMRSEARRPEALPSIIADARSVDNHLPIYYNKHGLAFRQGMPILRAVAPSEKPLDKLAAELGTRLLELREDVDHGNEWALRMSAVRQILLFGEALARVQWESDGGDGKGDVLVEGVPVFGFLKDAYSVGKWPPRFLIEMDCRHVDEIHDIYGAWVPTESGLVERTHYYDTLAVSMAQTTWEQTRPAMPDAAIVYRIFFSPCKTYSKGMCFHLVGDQILRRHALQAGRWPFARAVWEESELNLYPVGLIERLLTDQVQRNTLVNIGLETAIIKARGDLWISGPGGRKPREEVYNKNTGAKYLYWAQGTDIKPRETGMNFQDARAQLELIDDNMHDKANLPRPSLGQSLEKERTLGAQVLAQQAASTDAGEQVEQFGEQFLVPIAQDELALYAEYAVAPREIDMGQGDGMFRFHRGHLRAVREVTAIPMPRMSPAQKRSMIALAQAGGLMPPYVNARQEATARQTLISQGLEELEKMIAEQSVPLEEILELAKAERLLAYETQMTQAAGVLIQAKAAIAQMTQPAEEMPQGPGEAGMQGPGMPAESQGAPQARPVMAGAAQ